MSDSPKAKIAQLTERVEIRLKAADLEFLAEVAEQENLNTISAAMRHCINTARRVRSVRR